MLTHGTAKPWGLERVVAEVVAARYKETSPYWEWETNLENVVNHVSCELKQLGCFLFTTHHDLAERVEFWPNKEHPTHLEQLVAELARGCSTILDKEEMKRMRPCILTLENARRPEAERCILMAGDMNLIIRNILKKGPDTQPSLTGNNLLEE